MKGTFFPTIEQQIEFYKNKLNIAVETSDQEPNGILIPAGLKKVEEIINIMNRDGFRINPGPWGRLCKYSYQDRQELKPPYFRKFKNLNELSILETLLYLYMFKVIRKRYFKDFIITNSTCSWTMSIEIDANKGKVIQIESQSLDCGL